MKAGIGWVAPLPIACLQDTGVDVLHRSLILFLPVDLSGGVLFSSWQRHKRACQHMHAYCKPPYASPLLLAIGQKQSQMTIPDSRDRTTYFVHDRASRMTDFFLSALSSPPAYLL